jgi:serine/threonine protein kinase/WD40 repeat protein/Tfp pilus assembly protein PilF
MTAEQSLPSLFDQLVESFIQRQRQGERPSIDEYLRQYPELASQIREVFPALELIEEIGAAPEPTTGPNRLPRCDTTAIPRQLGEYRILREIGRGGMGGVYEAVQESLGRHVALKVLPPQMQVNALYLERFRREAQAAARLHHTNIVPVFGVGEQDGVCYYAMQYIRGQTVEAVLQELRRFRSDAPPTPTVPGAMSAVAEGLLTGQYQLNLPVPETPEGGKPSGPNSLAVRASGDSSTPSSHSTRAQYFRNVAEVGVQVAEALGYAHGQGVVHRDIKPSNLMLDLAGTVWVADFGLAKAEDSADLTSPGDILGTLRYMAPEQLGGTADARSDVYSLGITLYELVTLTPAFDDPVKARLIDRIRQQEPSLPHLIEPQLPRDLETIILKATAKEPGRRYVSAPALAEDLRRFLADRPIRARRASWLEHGWRWCRRNRLVAGLLAFILVLLVGTVLGSVFAAFSFQVQKDQAQASAVRAGEKEAEAREQLWRSKLAQARAQSLARRPGQRVEALATLREALAVARETGLTDKDRLAFRNVAIGCLTLPDLVEEKVWEALPDRVHSSLPWNIDAELKTYARSDARGTVTVHRIADDRCLATIAGPGEGIYVRLSPDRRHVVTVRDKVAPLELRLWQLNGAGGADLLHQARGYGAAFRPDGKAVAYMEASGRIEVFDLERREVRALPGQGGECHGLSFSPDGRRLAVLQFAAGQWALQLRDADNGEVLDSLASGYGCGHAWHPAGRVLAYSSVDGAGPIHLYDTAARKEIAVLEGHQIGGIALAFDSTGEFLLSNDWSNLLRIWEVRGGKQQLALPAWGPWFAVGKEPEHFAAANPTDDGRLRLMRLLPGRELRRWPGQTHPSPERLNGFSPRYSARDELLAVAGVAPELVLLDPVTGDTVGALALDGVRPVGFDAAGNLLTAELLGICRWPRSVDPVDGNLHFGPPQVLSADERPRQGACSDDGAVISVPLVGLQGFGIIHADGRTFWKKRTPVSFVRRAEVSPDGRWVVTTDLSYDLRGVRVWDARSGDLVKELPSGGPNNAGFSPDGRWLWSTGGEGRLWRVGAWEPGPVIGGEWVALSADGRMVATGDGVDLIRLADPETGAELARLPQDEGERLFPRLFSPDGSRLYAWGQQSSALFVWDLRLLREQLAELGLDLDLPPLPPPAPRRDRPRSAVFEIGPALHDHDAQRLLRERKYPEAIAELQKSLRIDDDRPEPWFQLGKARHALKEYAAARDDLTRALKLNGEHVEAYHYRSHCHRQLGDVALALADIDEAIRRKPGDAHFHDMRAGFRLALNHPREAAADWEKSLELQKDQAPVLYSLAQLYLLGPAEVCNPDRAFALARRGLELTDGKPVSATGPTPTLFLTLQGAAWYRQEKYEAARAALEQAARGERGKPTASTFLFLAMAQHRLGDANKAKQSYERGLEWRKAQLRLAPLASQRYESLRAETESVLDER